MTDPLRRICAEQGVFLRREALTFGYDDKAISRACRDGVFHRVRHGAYAFADDWRSLNGRQRHRVTARAVLRAARVPILLSHVTAALEYGAPLWDFPLEEVHTTQLWGGAGRREAGIRHHQGRLLPGDRTELGGLPVTSAARTAVDLVSIADIEHALVPINAMLHEGLLSVRDFEARLKQVSRWPHTLGSHLVLKLINPHCESVGETRSDYFFWAQGLPRPEPQVEIFDRSGAFVARVDFAWRGHKVFLEFDGRIKYQKLLKPGEDPSDVVIREKRREEQVCELTGWRCIRITWSDLARPERLATRIRAMLAGGPSYAA
ncbi:MAG: type IV toxin-antitoxin system AbiEi family antitoxin domain-containing protein [Nocardioides sp.]|nr:type IV toxin-antitoxin system AbiEi family antitoxin domain-containing protein [Nocardioides sp.]